MATINGYDALAVWEICRDYGLSRADGVVTVSPFSDADVTPSFDGDGVAVRVRWTSEYTTRGLWSATVNGSTNAPILKAFGVPHPDGV